MKYDNLLQHYVSRDELRSGLLQPKEEGEFVFASDAYQVIRMPKSLLEKEYPAHPKAPSFSAIWPTPGRMLSVPKKIEVSKLKSLIGSIPLVEEDEKVECSKCEGDGQVECPCCGNFSDCNKCHGTGEASSGKKIKVADERFKLIFSGIPFLPEFFENVLRCADVTGEGVEILTQIDQKMMLLRTGSIEIGIMPHSERPDEKYCVHVPLTESHEIKKETT